MMSCAARLLLLLAFVLPLSSSAEAQNLSLKDLQFTAVQPCRIYDTRPNSGVQGQGTGPIGANQTRDVDVSHGAAPPCGIPFPHAKAVVMNFIAVNAAGPGNLRAWPFGTAVPFASVINYSNVAGLNIANGVVQPICASTCTHDLTLRADVSATHVVIDVLGYFAPPGSGPLWGRGRPDTKMWGFGPFFCVNGAIQFGLSDIAVPWGSAADACPQGTWVCTAAQRGAGPCDTSRPDDVSCDGFNCDGTCINMTANNLEGWVADQGFDVLGIAVNEQAATLGLFVCQTRPVWCCRE